MGLIISGKFVIIFAFITRKALNQDGDVSTVFRDPQHVSDIIPSKQKYAKSYVTSAMYYNVTYKTFPLFQCFALVDSNGGEATAIRNGNFRYYFKAS